MLQISSKSWKVQISEFLQNFVICRRGVVGWADPDDGVLLAVGDVVTQVMGEGVMTLDMVEGVVIVDMLEEAVIPVMEEGVGRGLLLLAEVEDVG